MRVNVSDGLQIWNINSRFIILIHYCIRKTSVSRKMRKDFLVIGVVVLIGGVILLGISWIRETRFIARSINDDDLRAYLEAGEYHIHASYSVPEDHPKIKIYDSYDNLIYEKDYAPESDFKVPIAGFYSIHVTNVQEQNSVL